MKTEKRYIFTITTGRSGSNYLAALFRHVYSCVSRHEPAPVCNGSAMRKFLNGEPAAIQLLTAEKARRIHDLSSGSDVYFESNHCFIKGFGWFIPDYLPEKEIGVIVLRRSRAEIMHSWERKGTSPLTQAGRSWLATPDRKSPVVPPKISIAMYQMARAVKSMLYFAGRELGVSNVRYPQWVLEVERRCLDWYIDETYAMAELYKQSFPDISFYDVDIADLNTVESVNRMLSFFGCRGKSSLANVVGKRIHRGK